MRPNPDFTAVVVAAGQSDRFGAALPKQFHDLAGRTVVERSVSGLVGHPRLRGVVLVLADDRGAAAAAARSWPGVLDVVFGGATRAASVRAGVEAAGDTPFLLVHDAARPLVDRALVDRVIEATCRHGAALPVIDVPDTVKQVSGDGRLVSTLDREALRLAQTPQGFRGDWLRDALRQAERDGVACTDEAAAVERTGRVVATVPGDADNFKITTPRDLERARERFGAGGDDMRIGTGFDIHRFGDDRKLVLGGVVFPGEAGLLGHSDADVVLHAAMDALLGAAGLGDIGVHFPPDDPAYAGADSAGLAAEVADLVRREGFEIVNLDLALLAERPRVAPHASAMKQAIGRCLGLDPARVGLKATTLEGLGALGRGEGVACQAVALIRERGRG